METKVNYEIYKGREDWILQKVVIQNDFKNGRGNLSTNILFKGSKKECQEKLKEMKGEKNGRSKKRIGRVKAKTLKVRSKEARSDK